MRNAGLFSPFIIALLALAFPAIAQQEIAIRSTAISDTIIRRFDHYRLDHLQEKIYAHTDRNFYMTGELMWFKLYCVDGALHQSLDLSDVAYVELFDAHNASVVKGKIALANGMGAGSFYLPASLVTGSYTLRAYTTWMRNGNPEFFFHKTITIINPFVDLNITPEKKATSYAAEFFPEGGTLVQGLKSTVAFAIKNEEGKGVDGKLAIVSAANDTLTTTKTLHLGLGSFDYTPQADAHDRVVFIDVNKKTTTYNLPTAVAEGYTMHVRDSAENFVLVTVNNNHALPRWVSLFVHARQVVSVAEARRLDHHTTFMLDKRTLGDGISHLTLFDEKLQPLCERLYFNYPRRQLVLNVSTDQHTYATRRKVDVHLTAVADDKTVASNLSVSVFKVDSLNATPRHGIFEYVWLSSDLTGTVESPEYYFSNTAGARQAIDLVMLTHGWRRFQWSEALNNKPLVKFLPEHHGHVVHGKVLNIDGTPAPFIRVFLSSPDKVIQIAAAISDKDGFIKFELPDFWGSRQLIAQAQSEKPVHITIENPFSENSMSYVVPSVTIDPRAKKSLIERSIFMQTQDIYYEGQRDHFYTPLRDTTAFYGTANETYMLDDYTRFPVMEEVMREYVPGVRVRRQNDKFIFVLVDATSKNIMHGEPLILLDGVMVSSADAIMAFDPRKIKKLEVVTKPYFIGATTQNGIVSYTTYNGDLAGFTIDPGALVIDYDGLQLQREFLQPVYLTDKQRLDKTPDFRNLLAWYPDVKTGNDGKLELQFFTSDLTGDYIVVIEGMTANGVVGSGTGTFSVKDAGQ